VTGHGTISFQRDLSPPLVFMDVLYVPGLKKNLISVSSIQDRELRCPSEGQRSSFTPRGPNSP
jgi:hypothetical protein